MIDLIVSGGINLTVEDTGDIINVVVEVAAPMVVEVVVGVPTKENIVGLSKNDSPEFADVVIPDIAEENTYTSGAWAWLTGLFGTVTGSVKAMLIQLVEKVSLLDGIVTNYSINVPVDVASIEIGSDAEPLNISKGAVIEIGINFLKNVNTPVALYRLEINGLTSGYLNAGSSNSQYFIVYAPLFENAQNKGTIYFNDTLLFQNWALRKQDGTVSQQISTINSYVNFSDEKINKITIRTAESGKVIAANSKINIKILR